MTIKKNSVIIASESCREIRSIGNLSSSNHPHFKLRCGCLGYAWIAVAFFFLILTSSTPACAQTFSDDFNRPNGAIDNDWGSWNGSTLVNGQLQTFGSNGVGGGIFRTFPVTLPLKFSFDFRSESPHPSCDIGNHLPGGGWLIAFNAPGAGYAGAQIEFLQFYGSQFVLRQYQTSAGTFADILPSSSPDFGPAFVHISGTVNADLSATLTIGSATYDFPPVASPLATATGSNLAVSNSSCGGGPFFFDNLSVTSGICPVKVDLSTGIDRHAIFAEVTPLAGTLATTATRCGYIRFNFQQRVIADPFPPVSQLTGLLLVAPYPDPPLGGYEDQPESDNHFPFYYNLGDLTTGVIHLPPNPDRQITTETSLTFADAPAEPRLRPLLVQDLEFETKLVGIPEDGSSPQVLSAFTWSDNFNGVVIGGFSARSNWLHPLDSASGTGGITITGINGVPQTPPSVSCTASPNTLWPPNDKPVLVTVSGNVTPGTQAIIPGSSAFTIADNQGASQPSGAITVGSDGSYSFTVPLSASRDGNNENGRQYTITISASDQIGNVGSCSTVVTVPHDQGH